MSETSADDRGEPAAAAPGLLIRQLEPADLEEVVALSLRAWAPVFASFAEVLGPRIYPLVYPDWPSSQAAAVRAACAGEHVFVAELGDGPVGFAAVMIRDDDPKTAELDMIAVDPASQRHGVGHALTTFVEDYMRAAGVVVADIATGGDRAHEPARRTYEKAGFTALPLVRYYKAL